MTDIFSVIVLIIASYGLAALLLVVLETLRGR